VDDTFFALANGFSQNHEVSYPSAGTTKCKEVTIDESDLKILAKANLDRESTLSVQGLHVGTVAKRISICNKFGINYHLSCHQPRLFRSGKTYFSEGTSKSGRKHKM
jgi:hypothetical protein